VIAVRPALPADLARLEAIHAEAFARPWPAAELQTMLASDGVSALVAEGDGALAGFIMLRVVADEGEILTLAVSLAMRRRGAGQALVLAAADSGRLTGAHTLWLEVADDNPAARQLYEQMDFVEIGRRKGYYPRPEGAAADAVVLRRILNSPAPSAYAAAP
jgi:ribosomal-protein-alanine N-acetyltransferase